MAIEYSKLAVEKSHKGAMNNLGNIYRDLKNIEEAKKYYIMAIHFGSKYAFVNALTIMTKQELYLKLIKLLENDFVNKIINKLFDDHKLRMLHNKIKHCSKIGDCPICFEENVLLVPTICCFHFYCPDCYMEITKCSICRMSN